MNLHRYLIFAFCCAISVVLASNNLDLTEAREQELKSVHGIALEAIISGDLNFLRSIFESRRADVNDALFFLKVESLLFNVLSLRPNDLQFYAAFAEFGIEMGGSQNFRRCPHDWNAKCSSATELFVYQELVLLGLIQLEDLWILAIRSNSFPLFNWVLMQGADLNHQIPDKDHYYFVTVAGTCYKNGRFKMLEIILELGINVNASP